MAILEATDLVKQYGGRTVVDHVSFTVGEGQIVGLLGPNGAGKSTSFRMVMGMVTPEQGQVTFNGSDVTDLPMYQRARRGMGYLAQNPSVFQRMTVEANLIAVLETRPLNKAQRKARAEALLEQFSLTKTRKQLASSLSGGERRKLEIARALVTDPTLLLLDEPFYGVDPKTVDALQEEITRLRDELDIAVLITDHNVEHTLRLVDRAYILVDGKVFADGTSDEIIANPQVRERYLGSTFDDRPMSP